MINQCKLVSVYFTFSYCFLYIYVLRFIYLAVTKQCEFVLVKEKPSFISYNKCTAKTISKRLKKLLKLSA